MRIFPECLIMDLNIHNIKNFTLENFSNTIHDGIRPQQIDEVQNAFNARLWQ